MSLFSSLMGDMEDDPIFGSHMRTMRQMNSMMNSLFADPFAMMGGGGAFGGEYDNRLVHRGMPHNPMMPFPMMPNLNRLLGGSLDSLQGTHALQGPMSGHHFGNYGNYGNYSSSSTVVSMTSGPDGRPQVYKATSSTRVAPGGVKETQKTVTDSRTGTKKMAIGHHIGERAHIIEKEQNMHTGDREEREDFINLDEDEADDFNREWENKTRSRSEIPRITAGISPRHRHSYAGHSGVPAITAGSSRRQRDHAPPMLTGRRSIRSPKLAITSSSNSQASSSHAANRTPYSHPSQANQPRKSKNLKTVSDSGAAPDSPPSDA